QKIMLDPVLLRKELPVVIAALKRRNVEFDEARFNQLEARRKEVQIQTETLQAQRNTLAKQIGQLKSKGEDASAVLAESQAIPARLKALEEQLGGIRAELDSWLMTIPNLPHSSVPDGKDSDDNVEVRRWLGVQAGYVTDHSEPAPKNFDTQDHVTVGDRLGLEFDTAVKLTGARFSFMRGGMARLHRALAQFMLDLHTIEHGYTECYKIGRAHV